MWLTWTTKPGGWTAPAVVGEPATVPGGSVSLAQQNNSVLTAAFIGGDGLHIAWVADDRQWNPAPEEIPGENPDNFTGVPGGSVALAKQHDSLLVAVTIDLRAARNNLWPYLMVAWEGNDGPWNNPRLIGPGPSKTPAPAKDFNVALSRQATSILTAAFIDQDGLFNVAWVENTDAWHPPVAIPTAYSRARSLMDHAQALRAQGVHDEAAIRAMEAIAAAREIVVFDPAYSVTLAEWLTYEASAYLDAAGRGDEVNALLEEGAGIYRQLSQNEPQSKNHRWGLSNALMWLGFRLWAKGDRDQAVVKALESVSVLRRLTDEDPAYADALGHTLLATSNFLSDQKRHDEAIAMAQEAVDSYLRLSRSQPQNHQYRNQHANAIIYVATHQWAKGDHAQGLAKALESVGLYRQLVADHPEPEYADSLGTLLLSPTVGFLVESGQRADTITLAKESVEIYTRLNNADPVLYGPKLAYAKQRLEELQH